MKNTVRVFSALLAILLLISVLLPAAWAAEPAATPFCDLPRRFTLAEERLLQADVFANIDGVVAAARRQGGGQPLTVADYCAMLPQVREAVEASATYAPGTLRQNGSFLSWKTVGGFACCFDPRMEFRIRSASPDVPASRPAPEAVSGEVLADPGNRPQGGSPASMRIGLVEPFYNDGRGYFDPGLAQCGPDYVAMLHRLSGLSGGIEMRLDANTATVDNIARLLEHCGIVMFESHGVTDYYDPEHDDETSRANCSYLVLTTPLGLTAADMDESEGEFGRYFHAMIGRGYAEVSGYCIANHMQKTAPHNLLYMCICSGMATEGMFAPLREKGVETVWGYSQPVYNVGDNMYMQKVLGGVCEGLTFAQAVAEAKAVLGNWDPYFQDYTEQQCVAERVAFPIVVSSEDPYPGHDGTNAVQTVHSGWELIGSTYRVLAVSQNETMGTVSAQGTRITAYPAEGYLAEGSRVLSGSASVRQDGNLFVVTPSSDCTVQIRFRKKNNVAVRCMAGDETVCTLNTQEGDPVTLPDSAPEIQGWELCGWAETRTPIGEEKPAFYAPGAEHTTNVSCSLYALYTRVSPDSEASYRLVTEAPEDWSGDYVLTSWDQGGGDYVLRGIPGDGRGYIDEENDGSRYLFDSGIKVDGDVLRHVEDSYVFTFSEQGAAFTIQSKACGTYLADHSGELVTLISRESPLCQWVPGFQGDQVTVKSTVNTRYTYLCCDRTYGFFLYEKSLKDLRLWKSEPGTIRLYASDPMNHDHLPGAGTETNRVEPTCTEPGEYDLEVRCVLCDRVLESAHHELPALGHDWEEPVYTWAEDNGSVTAARGCRRDPGHRETETVQTTSAVTKEATETEDGEITYTAVFANPAFSRQSRSITVPKTERVNPFTDVIKGKYYYDAVLWASSHQPRITAGTGPSTFSPEGTCTRGQVVTFLWRAAGKPKPNTAVNPFADVREDAYYYKAVLWAAEQGITAGTAPNRFSPDAGCTRGQAVTFLWRAAGKPKPNTAGNPFADVREDAYDYKAVLWAAEHRITSGTTKRTFSPNRTCTRGQVVTFLYRYMAEEPQ